MAGRIVQINLQQGFGGGEVYAACFARALAGLGVESVLAVHPQATAWSRLPLPGVTLLPVAAAAELPARIRGRPDWIASHHALPATTVAELKRRAHRLAAFAHMPLYGRDPAPLLAYDRVLAVSKHVIASLKAAGIERLHPEPLYGVAELGRQADGSPIQARSRYEWDRRKLRDRLLGRLEPIWRPRRRSPAFSRRPGFTLGVVSRLTPIKQFPLLFSLLVPVLARHPEVNLEIFGSGGYASVRDLDRALAPLGRHVRFWGEQSDVAAIYRQLDALLTGLPEKEALGLNVLEAQACGTPVLAPDAPPFDETVVHGVTGLRYRDPRLDGGAGFEAALAELTAGAFRFDAAGAAAHRAGFSMDAFVARSRRLLGALAEAP